MVDATVERLQQDRAVRYPRRRRGDLSVRRGPRDGHAARSHHRYHPRPPCSSPRSRKRAERRIPRHQGTLPRTAPSRPDGIPSRQRSSLGSGKAMTAQDTTPALRARAMASFHRAQAEHATAAPASKPVRRLPVQKDWPTWALVAAQIGILVGALSLWEIGARTGWIDAFFWSQPSAIAETMTVFFTTGDAWTDISFTFRSTIIGLLTGTTAGSLLGLSFWWSRNYAAVVQPYVICLESIPKLALAPLIILVFGIGLVSKVAVATALTLVVSTLTAYAGVKALDPDGEKLFYSLGASRLQVFRKLVVPFCLPWIISVLRVNIGLALTGAIVGEFIASQHGLGRAILYAGQTYDIALVWVAVLVLSTLAIVMYAAVSWVESMLRKGVRQ